MPVYLGEDEALATKMASAMLEKGIYVIGLSFPVVPKGQAWIKVQISAAHEREQVEHCVEAVKDVGKELGVLEN